MPTAYAATNSATQVASDTASELVNLLQIVVTKLPLWAAAVIFILGTVIGAKIVRKMVENKLAESGIEEEHKELQILGGRLSYSGVLIIGVTIGLKIAGIDLTSIIAAAAFGIGFALKDIIMNFIAGVMILISRHFTIGDFINVGGTVGKIIEIQSRVTILQAIDGTKVIVPNGELFKKQVTSYTSNPFRRIEVKVGVDYRNNLENAIKIAQKATKETKGVLVSPKFAVVVNNFTDNGVELKIKAWVESRGGWVKIKSSLAENLKKAFDENGIRIPWPIRTVVDDKDQKLSEKILEDKEEEKTPEPKQTPAPAAPAAQPAPAPAATTDQEQPLKPLGER